MNGVVFDSGKIHNDDSAAPCMLLIRMEFDIIEHCIHIGNGRITIT